MLKTLVFISLLGVLVSSCGQQPQQVQEAERQADLPADHSLIGIMNGLEADLAEVAHGIWIHDPQIVANAATRIADHPKVSPEQLSLIKAELGDELAGFVGIDGMVHSAAVVLADSARVSADPAVLFDLYQRIEQGCFACHATYQERISVVLADNEQ